MVIKKLVMKHLEVDQGIKKLIRRVLNKVMQREGIPFLTDEVIRIEKRVEFQDALNKKIRFRCPNPFLVKWREIIRGREGPNVIIKHYIINLI